MGSRIGFTTRDQSGEMPVLLRKQWAPSIREVVEHVWKMLGGKPDDGSQAIRHDLNNGRAFAALAVGAYEPPFDSIEHGTDCDISDNGLIIVDITDYKNWRIFQVDIYWEEGQCGQRKSVEKLLATMSADGFNWEMSIAQLAEVGEGIS